MTQDKGPAEPTLITSVWNPTIDDEESLPQPLEVPGGPQDARRFQGEVAARLEDGQGLEEAIGESVHLLGDVPGLEQGPDE